jgi:ribosome maturation factor RimP
VFYGKETIEALKKIIQPVLEAQDTELVALSIFGGREKTLRLLVDKKTGGITLAECASINRLAGEAIEASGIIDEGYLLEVSSPGLDRPLKGRADFLRCLDKKVKVFLRDPVEGKWEIEGLIRSADEQAVLIESQGLSCRIGLDNILKANQVV